jgi:hypothetical protein
MERWVASQWRFINARVIPEFLGACLTVTLKARWETSMVFILAPNKNQSGTI